MVLGAPQAEGGVAYRISTTAWPSRGTASMDAAAAATRTSVHGSANVDATNAPSTADANDAAGFVQRGIIGGAVGFFGLGRLRKHGASGRALAGGDV